MSLFFESIRIVDGQPENLSLHQERVNRSLKAFEGNELFLEPLLRRYTFPQMGLFKFRVSYDLVGVVDLNCSPYRKKNIQSIALKEVGDYEYDHKFENRDFIEQLKKAAVADEIIMVKKGLLTDASYANVALYQNDQWWTPGTCLLAGTQRQRLLEQEVLVERDIQVTDLNSFTRLKLFNAMMPWEDCIELSTSVVYRRL